jgi:hypothetical protein
MRITGASHSDLYEAPEGEEALIDQFGLRRVEPRGKAAARRVLSREALDLDPCSHGCLGYLSMVELQAYADE